MKGCLMLKINGPQTLFGVYRYKTTRGQSRDDAFPLPTTSGTFGLLPTFLSFQQ
jgi:hypothetical protein